MIFWHYKIVNNNLKKLIYILPFLILISLLSCCQNSSEKQLNGKWYEIGNCNYGGGAKWHFYPDSLIVFAEYNEKIEWSATTSKIEFEYPTFYQDSSGKFAEIIDEIIINYKLSDDKDSLFGTSKNVYEEREFGLLRAKNYIEFLAKKYGMDFSIPKDNSAELIKSRKTHGLNVFMEYSDNKIVGKTELSNNLNHFKSDIITFKDRIHPDEREELMYDKFHDFRFHVRVYADKKIPDSIITQYLSVTIESEISKRNESVPMPPPVDTLPIKIYRIYRGEEEPEFNLLRTKEIKTNAKYVYN